MKVSSILSWENIISIIHRPLPFSARDSRHLLSLLNISFTEALDKKHPKVSSEGRNTTDKHVHYILSSPMFGPRHSPPSKKHTLTTPTELFKSMTHGPLESNSIANAMVDFNMNSFRNQIVTGRANLVLATTCLRDSTNSISCKGGRYGFRAFKGFGKHGMASMMLNWLWSSGLGKSDEVLWHTEFLPLLSPFLAAEGHLEEAMQWFWRLGAKATLYSSDSSSRMDAALAFCPENAAQSKTYPRSWDEKIESLDLERGFASVRPALRDGYTSIRSRILLRQRQQAMLHPLVLYSLAHCTNKSLNTAINIFVEAITSSNMAGMSPMEIEIVFRRAGCLIVEQIQSGLKADPSEYDAFLSTVPIWSETKHSMLHHLVRSIINFHDPKIPDWEPAYYLLRNLRSITVKRSTLWERRSTVSLGLDTATMLLSDGRSSYARRAKKIMESLQQHFGDELGALTKSMEEARKSQHIGQLEPMTTDFELAM